MKTRLNKLLKKHKGMIIFLSIFIVFIVFSELVFSQMSDKEAFKGGAIYVLDSSETYTFNRIHTPKVASSDIEQIVYSEENQTIFIELTSDYLEKNRNNTPAQVKDNKEPIIGSSGGSVWLNATSEKVVLITNKNGAAFLSLPQPSTSSYYPEGLKVEDVEKGLLISVNNKNAALFSSLIQLMQLND